MEIIGILAEAKALVRDPALVVTLIGIYMRLESSAKKRDKAMTKLNDERWDKLIATLDTHNQKNEERFIKIETHIGLKP